MHHKLIWCRLRGKPPSPEEARDPLYARGLVWIAAWFEPLD
jgi:hypothetical protein